MESSVLRSLYVCAWSISSHKLVVAMQICIYFSLPAVLTDNKKQWVVANSVGIPDFYHQIRLSKVTIECTAKIWSARTAYVQCRHATKENELQHCMTWKTAYALIFRILASSSTLSPCQVSDVHIWHAGSSPPYFPSTFMMDLLFHVLTRGPISL